VVPTRTDERQRQETRLRQLDDERTKLLQAHYAGAAPLDLLATEQTRITNEISIAKSRLATAEAGFERVEETVRLGVAKAKDCHAADLEAGAHDRRLMNQAFFNKVWVTEDGVVGWDYNQPFATLMEAHGAIVTKLPVMASVAPERPSQATRATWSISRPTNEDAPTLRSGRSTLFRVRDRNIWRREWDSNPR
jgi:hypothetical protein